MSDSKYIVYLLEYPLMHDPQVQRVAAMSFDSLDEATNTVFNEFYKIAEDFGGSCIISYGRIEIALTDDDYNKTEILAAAQIISPNGFVHCLSPICALQNHLSMKETETYYQVRLTEVLPYGAKFVRNMRVKFPTVDGAKGYAGDLLDLLAEGYEGSCDKCCDRFEIYTEDILTGETTTLYYAEILDQDGNVQQI